MKAFKTLMMVAVIGIVAVGCGKVEKILPKKDGLWVGVSSKIDSYVNDSLTGTETQTDSLGEMFFAKDGTGYSADYTGDQTPITWTVNDDNDQITIADSAGANGVTYDILESSSKAMTWFTSMTMDILGDIYKYDITVDIERK